MLAELSPGPAAGPRTSLCCQQEPAPQVGPHLPPDPPPGRPAQADVCAQHWRPRGLARRVSALSLLPALYHRGPRSPLAAHHWLLGPVSRLTASVRHRRRPSLRSAPRAGLLLLCPVSALPLSTAPAGVLVKGCTHVSLRTWELTDTDLQVGGDPVVGGPGGSSPQRASPCQVA